MKPSITFTIPSENVSWVINSSEASLSIDGGAASAIIGTDVAGVASSIETALSSLNDLEVVVLEDGSIKIKTTDVIQSAELNY